MQTQLYFLLVQLALVFLPGLIWTQLAVTYSMKEPPGPMGFLVRAFIFGHMAYAVVYLLYGLFGTEFSVLPVTDLQPLPFWNADFADELFWASVVAFVLSLIWIYCSSRRFMTRILNRMRMATTHGKGDVWDLTFSQPDANYACIRDLDKGIVYAGWIEIYSETGKLRELLLRDASIWDKNSDAIEEVPFLYLAKTYTDVRIEFRYKAQPPKSADALARRCAVLDSQESEPTEPSAPPKSIEDKADN